MLRSGSLPHPGIGPMNENDNIRHHAYYQWVPFFLFAQALMFYLPHKLWRSWEGNEIYLNNNILTRIFTQLCFFLGGKIKLLVDGLQMVSLSRHIADENSDINARRYFLPSKKTVGNRVRIIKCAFLRHIRVNRFWAARLIFCEYLNLFNLVLQVYITNRFLGGHFYSLGPNFIKDDFRGIMDTLDTVFPKVTKCHFYKYGASGTIQKIDALCVMALNVVNEKIFVILWFWYTILAGVTVLAILWRIATLIFHSRYVMCVFFFLTITINLF